MPSQRGRFALFVVGSYRGGRRPRRLEASGVANGGSDCARCWIRTSENSLKAKLAYDTYRDVRSHQSLLLRLSLKTGRVEESRQKGRAHRETEDKGTRRYSTQPQGAC
jgi:hypothetical protein